MIDRMEELPLAGRTAIVTGASAGIGAAFAGFLAARGAAVCLVARRLDRLQQVAQELQRAHGVRTHAVAADLAELPAAARVVEECQRALGAADILINNAGYGPRGGFLETPWQEHAAFMQVMMCGYAELMHRTLPHMKAQDYGRVVNVSSLASFAPEQRGSMYGPAKRFVTSLSRAVALDLEGTNVHVCASCPGFTYSEFHDVMGNREHMQKLPQWMWTSADLVVRRSWEAVEAGRPVEVIGSVNKGIAALCWALPGSLASAIGPKSLRERGEPEAFGKGT